MTAEMIASLASAGPPVLAGLIATAWGWQWFGGSPDSSKGRPRQAMAVLGPLLLTYGLSTVLVTLFTGGTTRQDGRAMFVAAANSRAGEAVDKETFLVSVTDAQTHIQFDYKLHRVNHQQIDARALNGALSSNMVAYLCGNDSPNQALQAWGPFQMRYVDAEDVEVTVFSMTADECP